MTCVSEIEDEVELNLINEESEEGQDNQKNWNEKDMLGGRNQENAYHRDIYLERNSQMDERRIESPDVLSGQIVALLGVYLFVLPLAFHLAKRSWRMTSCFKQRLHLRPFVVDAIVEIRY